VRAKKISAGVARSLDWPDRILVGSVVHFKIRAA
jgi:hypothetical protein